MPAKHALCTERHPRFLSLFFKAIKQPVWASQADLEITPPCAAELTSLWPHAESNLFCKLRDSEATVCICPQRTCKHEFICCSITSQFMLLSQRVVACAVYDLNDIIQPQPFWGSVLNRSAPCVHSHGGLPFPCPPPSFTGYLVHYHTDCEGKNSRDTQSA